METSARRVLGVTGLVLAVGCAARSHMAAGRLPANTQSTLVRAVIGSDDGTGREISVMRWSQSATRLVSRVPVREIVLNTHGDPIGFVPAWTPAPGVQEPPNDVAIRSITVDRKGRLIGWKVSE